MKTLIKKLKGLNDSSKVKTGAKITEALFNIAVASFGIIVVHASDPGFGIWAAALASVQECIGLFRGEGSGFCGWIKGKFSKKEISQTDVLEKLEKCLEVINFKMLHVKMSEGMTSGLQCLKDIYERHRLNHRNLKTGNVSLADYGVTLAKSWTLSQTKNTMHGVLGKLYARQQELMKEMAEMYRLTGDQIETEIQSKITPQGVRLRGLTTEEVSKVFKDTSFLDQTKSELASLPNGKEQRSRISEIVNAKFDELRNAKVQQSKK